MKMDGLAYQNFKKILKRVYRKGAVEKNRNVTRDISQDTLPLRDNVKLKTGEVASAKEDVGRGAVSPVIFGVWSNHDLGLDRQD